MQLKLERLTIILVKIIYNTQFLFLCYITFLYNISRCKQMIHKYWTPSENGTL